MSLVDHCGLVLKKSHHDENGDEEDPSDGEESRFTVASDMRASDRTPLKMNWPQFVWLALALDISAYDPGWESGYPCTLKNSENEPSIYLFYEEDRLFAKFVLRGEPGYSLQRAFAWYNVKLDGDRLLPLGHGESAAVCLESVTISPELSTCRLGKNLTSQGCSDAIVGEEPQNCTNTLAAACSWMLYWRRQRLEFNELLPVSQHLLECRQRTLCHLKLLDTQNKLVTKVRSLVLASQDTNKLEFATTVVNYSNSSVPSELAKNVDGTAEKLNASPDAVLSTLPLSDPPLGPVEAAPLSARDQSLVDAILEQLRSSFASSRYVQTHAELHYKFRLIKRMRQDLNGHKNIWLLHSDWTQLFWQVEANPLLSLVSEPRWSSLEIHSRQSTRNRNRRDLYNLIPSKLKARFESAIQAWASKLDSVSWRYDLDGTDNLACIALALADWDDCSLQEWRPRDGLQSLANRVNEVLFDVKAWLFDGFKREGDDFLRMERDEMNQLESLLQSFTADTPGKGLYTAPSENPVTRLLHLRDKDSIVYWS